MKQKFKARYNAIFAWKKDAMLCTKDDKGVWNKYEANDTMVSIFFFILNKKIGALNKFKK